MKKTKQYLWHSNSVR